MARATRYSNNNKINVPAKKMCIYLLCGIGFFLVSLLITRLTEMFYFQKTLNIILSIVCSVLAVSGIVLYFLRGKNSLIREICVDIIFVVIMLLIPLVFGTDGGKMIEVIIPSVTVIYLLHNILRNESTIICLLSSIIILFVRLIDIKTDIFYVEPHESLIVIYSGIVLMVGIFILFVICKKNKGKISRLRIFPESSNYLLPLVGAGLGAAIFIFSLFFREFIINFGIYFVLVYGGVSLLYYILRKFTV
ncbi:MAG: hypothetical protein IKZ25_02880 [Clostridia bacterium]|nr:hypothetical protein [Clostridia bacterium]